MLNERLETLREKTRSGYYHQFRTNTLDFEAIRQECEAYSLHGAPAHYFQRVVHAETPVIIPGEKLQFTRTVGVCIPRILKGREMENLAPDYKLLLRQGISGRLEVIGNALTDENLTDMEKDYLLASRQCLLDMADCAERYACAAEKMGENELAALLRKVPFYPAETLHEALQSIYFTCAMIRLSTACHIGFGRTDQYLLEYYRRDLAEGRETRESARDLLTEFFIMLSRDYDLYDGIQPGDNGQSMVLGGCLPDGTSAENELTILLMEVAADLAMIEPKINLRVSSGTSEEVLRSAARLSGCGLGFPQYCNDEVVIPGLVKFGYPLEKARDYIVAACWEFVVPGGRDVPNLFPINLALAADRAIRKALKAGEDFGKIKTHLKEEIQVIFDQEWSGFKNMTFLPNPPFSAFCTGALESRRDMNYTGGTHRNFGCHGCGSSTAADALAAVKHFVYDEKSIAPGEFLDALEKNFEGTENLRARLRSSGEQVGCGSRLADEMLKLVFNSFAEVLEEAGNNGFGGKFRPGTGSALNYVLLTQTDHPQRLHATADGRLDGEYISSSLAPAPGVKAAGILSVLESFRHIDYSRICNGGPITMELDPVYFKSEKAIEKMISFLRAFVRSGNQQLQLNTLDADLLRHAQQHPEEHRDLIVRVWGWSGYFVELDRVYQNQIISRQAFRG
ncbi:MAG: hypothetical protein IJZ19_03040 [Lentisphaeria bacterium]|nr:hypothetical protein [Lentisphaeria bacterium]